MVHSEDGPVGVPSLDQQYLVARADPALLDNPQIPASPGGRENSFQHVGDGEPIVQLPTRLARLGNFDESGSDAHAIPEKRLFLSYSFHAEVFAESPGATQETVCPDLFPPNFVVFEGVHENGLLGTTVRAGVSLFVPRQTQLANPDFSFDRALVDRTHRSGPRKRDRAAHQYCADRANPLTGSGHLTAIFTEFDHGALSQRRRAPRSI